MANGRSRCDPEYDRDGGGPDGGGTGPAVTGSVAGGAEEIRSYKILENRIYAVGKQNLQGGQRTRVRV